MSQDNQADKTTERSYTKAPRRVEGGSSDATTTEGGRTRSFGAGGAADQGERARAGAMEVIVSHNIEKAMKVLKRKLIKEGLFKELKARRYFEKPSVRRKRKEKESRKKVRKDEARTRRGPGLM
jgi:small subunit ribosomal protein S21